MFAPYRIIRALSSRESGLATAAATTAPEYDFKNYLDRLMKLIPGEVIGLYLVGNGLIPPEATLVLAIWAFVCLVGVVAVKAFGTADTQNNVPPDWVHVAISSVSFVIWIYTMGGPFVAWGLYVPYIGSLLVLAWTFFVPIFYHGRATNVSPVTAHS